MQKSPEGSYSIKEEAKDLVSLLRQSVAEFNTWREEHPDEAIDFHGLDFSSTSLRGVNFRKANLSEADFRDADLTNAKFTGAELNRAKFQGAILTGIDIPLSQIEGLDLHNATMTRKQFEDYIAGLEKTITFDSAE